MASDELKALLRKIDPEYEQYAEQLHAASFWSTTELAAAPPQLLSEATEVLLGPACAIVDAAKAAKADDVEVRAEEMVCLSVVGGRAPFRMDSALCNRKLQVLGLKDILASLGLNLVCINSSAPTIDEQGFTVQTYEPSSTVNITAVPCAGVSQTGSLLEGSICVNVLLERGALQCEASLLVDTECDLALSLSEYKANQLGLAPDGVTAWVEMGQGHSGRISRRGAVLTALLLEGEGEEQIKDPRRSTYLEVWSDSDTGGSSSSSAPSSAPGSLRPSSPDAADEADAHAMLKIKLLSPIHEGKDSCGYDAILGGPGMAQLNLGIDSKTRRLYRKKMPSLFRKLNLQQKE